VIGIEDLRRFEELGDAQAANGVPIRMALLALVTRRE